MALALLNPRSLSFRTFANPRLRSPADLDVSEYRRLEFPAGGAVGGARDIARAYAAFSGPRNELGLAPGDARRSSCAFPRRRPGAGATPCSRWTPPSRLDSCGRSFPSASARASGPSVILARAARSPSPTRDRDVAFAYVMNRLGFHLNDDPREAALRGALYGSLADMEGDAEK